MNFRVITLALLAALAFAADEAKLAASDQASIDKAIEASLAEPSKAYQAYQAALTKASEKAIKDLEKLKANAMKGNNLPLAVAIDGKIAEVKKGALGSEVVGRLEKVGDLLGDGKPDIKKMIVGTWTHCKNGNSANITLNANGTISNEWNEPWTYEINGNKLIITPVGSKAAELMIYDLLPSFKDTLNGKQGSNSITLKKFTAK